MIQLLSVIIGGVLAIAGGGFTQWYLYMLKVKEDERVLREQKLTEIISAVFEYDLWISDFYLNRKSGGKFVNSADPLGKIFVLVHLHFPTLEQPMDDLISASNDVRGWIIKKAACELSGKDEDEIEDFKNVDEPLTQARHVFLNETQKLAKSFPKGR